MTLLQTLVWADLALLVLTALLGLTSLMAWRRHRAAGFPASRITAHIALQITAICLWGAFALTGSLLLAWTTFAVITAGQFFGDLLMLASHRARHPGAPTGYHEAGADVLSFRRPAPALHAIVGAMAWFGMLGLCIAATLT